MARTSDIRQKEVINITNGKRMGAVIDIEFSSDGRIVAISVPGRFRPLDILKNGSRGIRIPWDRIRKIGLDVIMVEIDDSYDDSYRR